MQHEHPAGAVIAAAGMSTRMGEFKPLLKLGNMSFVMRVVSNFRRAGISPIVLVTGFRADELEKHVAGQGILCVRNPDYAATEMIDSVRLGLRHIEGRCSRAFLSPVDIPLFHPGTVKKLLQKEGPVVKPVFRQKAGHPVLADEEVFADILTGDGRRGLGGILGSLRERTLYVPVEDEGILCDADTPGDYAQLVALHNRQLFRAEIHISLDAEERLLTQETASLLRALRYDGTVKAACARLNISYRKAWNLLREAEERVGTKLVHRVAGGEYGGESTLTSAGESLLDRFDAFAREVQQFANRRFSDYFPSLSPDGPEE